MQVTTNMTCRTACDPAFVASLIKTPAFHVSSWKLLWNYLDGLPIVISFFHRFSVVKICE